MMPATAEKSIDRGGTGKQQAGTSQPRTNEHHQAEPRGDTDEPYCQEQKNEAPSIHFLLSVGIVLPTF